MHYNIDRRTTSLMFLVLSVIVLSAIFATTISNTTNARPSTSIDDSNYTYKFDVFRIPTKGHLLLSTNHNDSHGTGNYTPGIKFLVYKPATSGNRTVTLDVNNLDCSDLIIKQATQVIDDTVSDYPAPGQLSDTLGASYELSGASCNSDATKMTLTLPASSFAASDRFGDNYAVSMVHIRLKDPSSGALTRSVVVRTPDDGQTKLSYWGDQHAISRTGPDDFPALDSAPSITPDGDDNYVSIEFAPPCDFDPKDITIYWRDADSGAAPNDGQAVTYVVRKNGAVMQGKSGDAGDGTDVGQETIRVEPGNKYRISFYNVKSEPFNNTIKVWVPFDQAGFYKDCGPEANGWQVSWSDNYLRRDGVDTGQTQLGDIAHPEYSDSPSPNQNFEYIHDSLNSGEREITNLRWSKVCVRTNDSGNGKCYDPAGSSNDRWWSDQYKLVNSSYSNQSDYWNYDDNTQVIYYDRTVSVNGGITSNANFSTRGTGVGAGDYIGGPVWVWDTFNVTTGHGGTTKCVDASFWPSYGTPTKTSGIGTTDWTVPGTESRVQAPTLCVSVPYYYNLIPSLTISSNGNGLTEIQQGDAVNVTGTVRDTALGGGRQHTNSEAGKVKGVVEFVLAPNTAIPTIGAESMVGQEPCTWVGGKITPSSCARRGEVGTAVNANGTIAINGGRTAAETENMAVGTKLCYATYINHPRHINNDDYNNGDARWSYSPVQCKAIIKAPKVQFENGDVTVGRYRSDGQVHTVGGVTAACEPNVATSTIETTGAPSVVTPRANPHLYGSWAEYGAFAPGSISGFGTATRPFGIGMNDTNGAKRLMFSNTDDGQFSYGGQCLQNPFTAIKPDNITNLTTQTPQAFDSEGRLRLNELAEKYDASFDRTGYVSRGQNVDIAQPSSDIPVSQVRVSAKSKFATGNSGCPKLRIVASEGSTTDQDTKGVCSTSFETYTFAFHMNVSGPRDLNMQFVNDAWSAAAPSQANRDLVIQSVEVNGVQVYNYGTSSPGVSVLRTGAGSCAGSDGEGGLYLHADAVSAATGAYCYGLNIGSINAPVTEDPNHGPYNPLPAKTTITVSANALSSNTYASGASTANGCPQLYMTVISKSGGTNRADVQSVCQNTSGWADYVFTTNVGSKGIDSIEVGYDPPDAYGSTGTRDLFVRNINVNGLDYPTTRTATIDLRSNPAYKQPTDASIPQCTSPVDRISMYAAQDSADTYHCVGVRISNVVNPPPPPPPASVLDGTYDRFKGRDIVIYSQKNNPGDSCSSSSSGNLRISQNIAYRKDGFANVNELPRIVLMADCNITIADNVTEVNASLIAGDAIKTCTNRAETISECNLSLRVNGSLSANRLLLWRTYGADLVDAGAAQIPAESFNLSPSQMIAGYSRGINSAKATTVYEIDLPPRY